MNWKIFKKFWGQNGNVRLSRPAYGEIWPILSQSKTSPKVNSSFCFIINQTHIPSERPKKHVGAKFTQWKFCDSPYSVSATFWPICHISHPLSKVPLYSLKIPCPTGSFCWNPSSVSNLTKTQLFQLCPPLLFQFFLDFNCAVVRYRERPESCYFVRPYYRKNFAALKFSAGTGPMSLTWGYYYPIGWYQAKNSLIGLVWIGYMGSNMPQKWHFGFCHFRRFWQFWGLFIAISSYRFSSFWV